MEMKDATFVKLVLGKNIKYYRLKSGISQEKLAEQINSSPVYISDVECGRLGISP